MQLADAIVKGNVAVVRQCLSFGVNVTGTLKTPFGSKYAALELVHQSQSDEKTKCEIAQLLVDAGAKPDHADSWRNTPLHSALCSAPVLKVMLSARPIPNVNAKNFYDDTPLHIHAATGSEQCQLLIDAKADVKARGRFGMSPLASAVAHGNVQAIPVLLAVADELDTKAVLATGPAKVESGEDYSIGNDQCKEMIRKHQEAKQVCSCALCCVNISF